MLLRVGNGRSCNRGCICEGGVSNLPFCLPCGLACTWSTDGGVCVGSRFCNKNRRLSGLHSILETIREKDEAEEPFSVFDKSDNGRWIREEAVVDSGAVGCVTSKKSMSHLWTGAGGNEIKKEGKVTVNWRTDLRTMK